jgi:IS5 family transposase
MQQVTNVVRRRVFDGEKVPNSEKVFSIFESHTELIKRGRRGRPVEFGHKVLLTESKEKFITDYVVLEKNCNDSELLPLVIERHEERYGSRPESVAADKGFCPDADTYEDLEDEVDYLGVPRNTCDLSDTMMRIWQHWRAGIEGTISCLKRVFRLARCSFRGFKNLAPSSATTGRSWQNPQEADKARLKKRKATSDPRARYARTDTIMTTTTPSTP